MQKSWEKGRQMAADLMAGHTGNNEQSHEEFQRELNREGKGDMYGSSHRESEWNGK